MKNDNKHKIRFTRLLKFIGNADTVRKLGKYVKNRFKFNMEVGNEQRYDNVKQVVESAKCK